MFIHHMMKKKDWECLERKSKLLKAIANPLRLGVVELLTTHESLSVSELAKRLNCEQSLLSHNLSGMKKLGILNADKSGQTVYYQLKERSFIPVIKSISDCDCNLLAQEA